MRPSKKDEEIAALKKRIALLEEQLEQLRQRQSALVTPLGTPIRGSIVADLYPR